MSLCICASSPHTTPLDLWLTVPGGRGWAAALFRSYPGLISLK